ncbi:MAG: ribosome-associated translation inhibitor RaiA [Rhizobiaceae bacterium]
MNLRVSGKHMEIGDSFRARIEDRVGDAVEKFFDGGFTGHVTVEKSGSRFSADCFVRLDTGITLQATGEGQRPEAAFDAAADRVEKRLRRYKRRLKSHNNERGPATDIAYTVMAGVGDDEEELPEDYAPAIIAESTMSLESMSVASAVVELDTKDTPVFVFRSAANGEVNVVYRRPDGNIGWIDPSAAASND